LVVGGWWLAVGGWWFLVGGWIAARLVLGFPELCSKPSSKLVDRDALQNIKCYHQNNFALGLGTFTKKLSQLFYVKIHFFTPAFGSSTHSFTPS
jgi:hypothetical protein